MIAFWIGTIQEKVLSDTQLPLAPHQLNVNPWYNQKELISSDPTIHFDTFIHTTTSTNIHAVAQLPRLGNGFC